MELVGARHKLEKNTLALASGQFIAMVSVRARGWQFDNFPLALGNPPLSVRQRIIIEFQEFSDRNYAG